MSREPWTLVRVDVVRLEAAIAASGRGPHHLAQRIGTTPDVLQRLRRGGSATWYTVRRVAQALGIDPETLLAEPEPEGPPP